MFDGQGPVTALDRTGIHEGVVLPSEVTLQDIAHFQPRSLGLQNFRNSEGGHEFAWHQLRAVCGGHHPGALRGVDGNRSHAHERLPWCGYRQGGVTQLEMFKPDWAIRPSSIDPLPIEGHYPTHEKSG
jgi:hypothetical protein